ncbi:MAG: ATPase, T2SS/T4P/T4SS family, partial [Planctomycetota bacterium]
GHLVFSTLHTNDAAGAFARLMDMGVESFLVSSTVEGIMAQRLVRRLCPECAEEYHPNLSEMPRDFPFEMLEEHGGKLKRHRGCRTCRQIGYSGRTGIYELLATTERIRKLAQDRASTWDISKAAIQDGMRTLRQDGWRKAILGQTSVDEVLRVTKGDRLE